MSSGAICIAVSLAQEEHNTSSRLLASAKVRESLVIWGRLCLGAFMTLCGIQHFIYVPFVASLLPTWIPGAVFWTYFAAVALIAGGIGIVVPQLTRLAAVLSGAMIFSWSFWCTFRSLCAIRPMQATWLPCSKPLRSVAWPSFSRD